MTRRDDNLVRDYVNRIVFFEVEPKSIDGVCADIDAKLMEVEKGKKVKFTYDVQWIPTDIAYVYSNFDSNFWLFFGKLREARSRLYRSRILQVNTRLNSYLVRKEIEKKGHGERLKNENLNKRP